MREKLQWACGFLAKAKAKAMAKARVYFLVEAPRNSIPSIAKRLCQSVHGKRGWYDLAKLQAHCGVLSPPGEGCPQGGVGSPMLWGLNPSWGTEPMEFFWKLLITRIFPV
jgi:hypothetical protein